MFPVELCENAIQWDYFNFVLRQGKLAWKSKIGEIWRAIHSYLFTKVKVKSLSCVRLFVTPWTVAYQVPLSMGFFRQEYRSGLPFPSPGDLPNPGIEPRSSTL